MNNRKNLKGKYQAAAMIIGIIWVLFHLLTASQILLINPRKIRVIHLAFAMILTIFTTVAKDKWFSKEKLSWLDYLLILGVVAIMTLTFIRIDILNRMGGMHEPVDIALGIAGIILLFELARRVVSPGLIVLALLALGYAFLGNYVPGHFAHAGFSLSRIVHHLYGTGEGIFGFVLGVSAEIIIIFIIFGSVLQEVGVADFFYNLSNAIAGKSQGGPAKVAVISSGLMGMVSGETSANVATTGSFTIPLMKRTGYSPAFAGAVECAASAGGQILPPVMGATAFIIADTLGIPYIKLAVAALIPALLYFTGVFSTVHFRAVKKGLRAVPGETIPSVKNILKSQGFLITPLLGIVYLLIRQYTPTFAAFWGGIVLAVVVTSFHKKTRLNLRKIITLLTRGANTAMSLALACAVVGIIVGTASLTGITLTVSTSIFKLTGGLLLPSLIITMFVCIILGMGLPTTAAYVLTSISAAPVLLLLGIDLLPAHLFVLYFGIMSALTPPVATGAYTAAGLAGASPNKLGLISLKIALAGFIIPYLFIYNDSLILRPGVNPWDTVFSFAAAIMGIISLAAVGEGVFFQKLPVYQRILIGIGSCLLLTSNHIVKIAGLLIALSFITWNYIAYKRGTMSPQASAIIEY